MLSDILNSFEHESDLEGKTILIVGATGFIGSELGLYFSKRGCKIRGLDNSAPDGQPIVPYPCEYRFWDHTKPIPFTFADGVDVLINAAGVSMVKSDWTPEYRQAIIDSRVEITKHCVAAANFHKIPVMLQMSWTGYYGNTNNTWANESFPAGRSLTAGWCAAWEAATGLLSLKHTRLVIMRTSPVMSTTGGVLIELVDRYMLGIGASLRHHELYMSWVHITDFLSFVTQAISDESYEGVYNVCSAFPITYSGVHAELHKYYPQGVTFSIPTWLIKAAAGDKAKLVLQSSRIMPKRLLDRGFKFKFEHFDKAMKDLLNHKIKGLAHFRDRFFFPVPRREVYRKFADVQNWPQLYPPALNLSLAEHTSNPIREGTEVAYKLKYMGVNMVWREKVVNCDPGHAYQVIQLHGPFTVFEISRSFTEVAGGTLYDVWQRYQLSFGSVINFYSYKQVKKTQMEVRAHQRRLFNSWFHLSEPESITSTMATTPKSKAS